MMRLAILAGLVLACSARAEENDAKPAAPTETATATALKAKGRIRLLGAEVPPGASKRLTWTSGTAMEGFVVPVPVMPRCRSSTGKTSGGVPQAAAEAEGSPANSSPPTSAETSVSRIARRRTGTARRNGGMWNNGCPPSREECRG